MNHERNVVRGRVLRLQRLIVLALRDEGSGDVELPLAATLAIESELISLRQEARLEGKREGFTAGQNAARANEEGARKRVVETVDSQKVTPLHPTEWFGGERKR